MQSVDANTHNISESDLAVAESQYILWYNTASSLRKSVEPSWKIDVAIVTNYFPLYLAKREQGINRQQFAMVATAYRSLGRSQVESLVWNLREEEYANFWLPGPLSSCGFDLNENGSFEKFRKHRTEYFDALDLIKNKNKSESQHAEVSE